MSGGQEERPDTITLDDRTKAWFKGVAAGAKAQEQIAKTMPAESWKVQHAWFWLVVGRLSAGIEDQQEFDLFVQGASVRQPNPPEDQADEDDGAEDGGEEG